MYAAVLAHLRLGLLGNQCHPFDQQPSYLPWLVLPWVLKRVMVWVHLVCSPHFRFALRQLGRVVNRLCLPEDMVN
jgi:hypothetical protein